MNDTAGENRALAGLPAALERAGPAALAMRGLRDLLALQQADAWLQKGRELQELNSYTEAVDCFNRGLEVDPEHSILQFYLGLAYYDGDGVSLDYSLAFTWFRKAAEQGYTMGQTGLGLLYNGGWGVPQDYRVAAAWYQKFRTGRCHGSDPVGRFVRRGQWCSPGLWLGCRLVSQSSRTG